MGFKTWNLPKITIDKNGGKVMLEKYNDVLKVEDVAVVLKIGRNATYKLINDGVIKSLRVGRNIRIPKIYLIDYLSNAGYNKSDNMLCAPMSMEKGA